jgi:hypothetical protein
MGINPEQKESIKKLKLPIEKINIPSSSKISIIDNENKRDKTPYLPIPSKTGIINEINTSPTEREILFEKKKEAERIRKEKKKEYDKIRSSKKREEKNRKIEYDYLVENLTNPNIKIKNQNEVKSKMNLKKI